MTATATAPPATAKKAVSKVTAGKNPSPTKATQKNQKAKAAQVLLGSTPRPATSQKSVTSAQPTAAAVPKKAAAADPPKMATPKAKPKAKRGQPTKGAGGRLKRRNSGGA